MLSIFGSYFYSCMSNRSKKPFKHYQHVLDALTGCSRTRQRPHPATCVCCTRVLGWWRAAGRRPRCRSCHTGSWVPAWCPCSQYATPSDREPSQHSQTPYGQPWWLWEKGGGENNIINSGGLDEQNVGTFPQQKRFLNLRDVWEMRLNHRSFKYPGCRSRPHTT